MDCSAIAPTCPDGLHTPTLTLVATQTGLAALYDIVILEPKPLGRPQTNPDHHIDQFRIQYTCYQKNGITLTTTRSSRTHTRGRGPDPRQRHGPRTTTAAMRHKPAAHLPSPSPPASTRESPPAIPQFLALPLCLAPHHAVLARFPTSRRHRPSTTVTTNPACAPVHSELSTSSWDMAN